VSGDQHIKPPTKSRSLFDWLRDRAYDTVFHVGDTTQNFLWDAVYGASDMRSEKFHKRQLEKNARKTKKPLTKKEQGVFCKILKRGENEGLLEYWKRQKTLLNFPDKLRLIEKYRLKETKLAGLMKDYNNSTHRQKEIEKVEKQFRKIQSVSALNKQTYKGM